MRKVVAGKLHGTYVTEANLNYHGSITLDPDHCEEAGILPMEFVEVWNKCSGARISTYVILGERGSKCCILNGAAARTCQPGDQVIGCNSVYLHENELTSLKPRILTFDEGNIVRDRLCYSVRLDPKGLRSLTRTRGRLRCRRWCQIDNCVQTGMPIFRKLRFNFDLRLQDRGYYRGSIQT